MNPKILKALQDKKLNLDVMLLSAEDSPCVVTEWMSTGCLVLDAISGGYGLPMGRVTEIYGGPSTGKSLIASQVAAVAQEEKATVIYVDTETAVSKKMMEEVGVDIDNLVYTAPDTVEDTFKTFDAAIEAKKKYDPEGLLVLIWDSVAATSAKAEMDGEYGDAIYAMHARLISQGMRKLTRKIAKERVLALFLNQTRKKIGVMFGDDTATFGGMAMSFYSSVRVELSSGTKIKVPRSKDPKKKKFKVIGEMPLARVVKNKVAAPFREAKLPIYFGHGIDDTKASFEYLRDNEYISSSGGGNYRLKVNGTDLSFTKRDWEGVYDKNYDAIAEVILNYSYNAEGEDGDA